MDEETVMRLAYSIKLLAEAIDHLASNLPAGLNIFHHQVQPQLPPWPVTWGSPPNLPTTTCNTVSGTTPTANSIG